MPEINLKLNADLSGNLKQEIDQVTSSLERMERTKGIASQPTNEYTSRQESSLNSIRDQIRYFQSGEGRRIEEERQRLQEHLEEVKLPRPTLLQRLGGDAATHFGSLGKAAIGIGAPTAAVAGLAAVAEKAARGINILSNSTATYYEKQEALLSVFVPFYDKFAAFRDAITGVTEALRVLKMEAERRVESANIGAQFYGERATAEQRIAGARASIASVAAFPLVGGVHSADLMTLGGQIRYQNQLSRNAALNNFARAQRAEMSAAAENEAAQRRLRLADANNINARGTYEDAVSDFRQARNQRNRVLGSVGDFRWNQNFQGNQGSQFISDFFGGMRQSAMNPLRAGEARLGVERSSVDIDAARTQAERAHQEFQAASTAAMQTQQQLLERQAATRRSNLEIAKQELEVVTQQNQRMEEASVRLGRMSRGSRQAGLEALRSVMRVGIDNSSPEAIAAAESIDPTRIRNMARRSGADFIRNQVVPEFGTDDEGGFFDFAGGNTQENTQRRMVQIRAAFDDALAKSEDTLVTGLGNSIVSGLTRLIEALQKDFDRRIKDIEEKQLQRSSRGTS